MRYKKKKDEERKRGLKINYEPTVKFFIAMFNF